LASHTSFPPSSSFLQTFFSEALLKQDAQAAEDKEKADGAAMPEPEGDWTVTGGVDHGWHGGLGQVYKYPGDAKRSARHRLLVNSAFPG
jgi:hypothetical protein